MVGSWRLMAVDGGWWSLGAVLNKTKKGVLNDSPARQCVRAVPVCVLGAGAAAGLVRGGQQHGLQREVRHTPPPAPSPFMLPVRGRAAAAPGTAGLVRPLPGGSGAGPATAAVPSKGRP